MFLCGEPVIFCRLLSHFGKPVVGYISTPLAVAVREADRARWYEQFYEMAQDERHIFVVSTPIFGEMIRYSTGVSLPVVRPACLYTDASYWPVRDRDVLLLRTVSIFWDTECVLNHFGREFASQAADASSEHTGVAKPLTFHESTSAVGQERRVGYGAFAEFLAVVIYPYAFSQFWFYEFVAMGMPLFVPSRASLPLYVYQDYACCPEFGGHRPGHRPEDVHPHSPYDRDDWDALTYWTAFTDFALYDHVERFESVAELLVKLDNGDHRTQSQKIKQEHMAQLGVATTFWLGALARAARLSGAPKPM